MKLSSSNISSTLNRRRNLSNSNRQSNLFHDEPSRSVWSFPLNPNISSYSSLSPSTTCSIMLIIMLASFHFLLFSGTTTLLMAQAKPVSALEFHRPYDHRSAMNTLKELDKYYSQLARPRFGKRLENIYNQPLKMNNDNYLEVDSAEVDTVTSSTILDNGPYRWLLINRRQPLTKLTENYLLEILADNLERRQNLEKQQKQRPIFSSATNK